MYVFVRDKMTFQGQLRRRSVIVMVYMGAHVCGFQKVVCSTHLLPSSDGVRLMMMLYNMSRLKQRHLFSMHFKRTREDGSCLEMDMERYGSVQLGRECKNDPAIALHRQRQNLS